MKKIRKTISGLMIIFLIISLITPVQADTTYSFNVGVKANKPIAVDGDTVIVTVSMKDLVADENGINAFMANLIYDTKVFETVKVSDIEGLNSWTVNYNNNVILLERQLYTDSSNNMMRITFHVKDNAKIGETDIKISNASISVNNQKITAPEKGTSIEIKKVFAEDYEIKEHCVVGISPQTKVSDLKAKLTEGTTVTIYDKENKEVANTTKLATGMTAEVNEIGTFPIVVKGDINGDSVIDISDVALLKMHLLDMISLQNEYLQATDINLDGDTKDIADFSKILDVYFGIATL